MPIERPEQAQDTAFESLEVANHELRVSYERDGEPRELVYPYRRRPAEGRLCERPGRRDRRPCSRQPPGAPRRSAAPSLARLGPRPRDRWPRGPPPLFATRRGLCASRPARRRTGVDRGVGPPSASSHRVPDASSAFQTACRACVSGLCERLRPRQALGRPPDLLDIARDPRIEIKEGRHPRDDAVISHLATEARRASRVALGFGAGPCSMPGLGKHRRWLLERGPAERWDRARRAARWRGRGVRRARGGPGSAAGEAANGGRERRREHL